MNTDPSQRPSDQSEAANGWWFEPKVEKEIDFTPVITPEFRQEFVAWIQWAVRVSAEEVEDRLLRTKNVSLGETLAMMVCYDATVKKPEEQTQWQWIERCKAWERENAGRTNCVIPPLPWDKDSGVLSAIFNTQSKTAFDVRCRLQDVEL